MSMFCLSHLNTECYLFLTDMPELLTCKTTENKIKREEFKQFSKSDYYLIIIKDLKIHLNSAA